MAMVTKGEFITDILATSANIAAFRTFRTGTSELALAVNEAWESSNNVMLSSAFVQGLVNALVPSVLDTGALTRFNAEIARQNTQAGTPSVVPWKKYTISVEGNINVWLAANANGAECVVEPIENESHEVIGYLIQIRGTLPSPAVEV